MAVGSRPTTFGRGAIVGGMAATTDATTERADVRTLRERRGWTRSALAAETGLSPAFVQAVEAGYLPKRGTGLERIAAALGVSVDDLRGGVGG